MKLGRKGFILWYFCLCFLFEKQELWQKYFFLHYTAAKILTNEFAIFVALMIYKNILLSNSVVMVAVVNLYKAKGKLRRLQEATKR